MLLWKWNMQLGSPGDGSPEKTVIWLQIRATLETLEVKTSWNFSWTVFYQKITKKFSHYTELMYKER